VRGRCRSGERYCVRVRAISGAHPKCDCCIDADDDRAAQCDAAGHAHEHDPGGRGRHLNTLVGAAGQSVSNAQSHAGHTSGDGGQPNHRTANRRRTRGQ